MKRLAVLILGVKWKSWEIIIRLSYWLNSQRAINFLFSSSDNTQKLHVRHETCIVQQSCGLKSHLTKEHLLEYINTNSLIPSGIILLVHRNMQENAHSALKNHFAVGMFSWLRSYSSYLSTSKLSSTRKFIRLRGGRVGASSHKSDWRCLRKISRYTLKWKTCWFFFAFVIIVSPSSIFS